jgi:hypothetical protein
MQVIDAQLVKTPAELGDTVARESLPDTLATPQVDRYELAPE